MKRASAHDDDEAVVQRGEFGAGRQRWNLHRGSPGGKGGVTHKTKSDGKDIGKRVLGNPIWLGDFLSTFIEHGLWTSNVSQPPSTRPSPQGEGESFAVFLKIRATGFAG